MQEYMYDGKIKRAPSVFLGPKKRYYTDPRGDSTFSYEESVAQQNMQGKTRSELRQMCASGRRTNGRVARSSRSPVRLAVSSTTASLGKR